MIPQVKVGSTWLSGMGLWGDLEIEHRLQGGSWEMTWGMTTKRRHRDLVPGAPVSAWIGSRPIWSGVLREPDWPEGEFIAEGLCRQAELAPCLTSDGVTTTTPNTAIDNGISKGWLAWSRVFSISAAALVAGDTTDNINSIDDLLATYGEDTGRRYTVDPYGIVANPLLPTRMDPGPTFWDVIIEGDRIGTSDEKLAGTVVGRYLDSAAGGAPKTVSVGSGLPVVKADLSNRGPITAAKATTTVQTILDSAAAQVGLLGSFELTRSQIVSRPNLGMVTAPHRFRLRGQHDPSGLSASPVCTADQTRWNVAEGTLLVTPLGAPQRDMESIIETAGVAA